MRSVILTLAILLTIGCESQTGIPSKVRQQYEKQFALTSTPEAEDIRKLRDKLAESDEAKQVVIAGQIGGMSNPYDKSLQPTFPWLAPDGEKPQAGFFLIDDAAAAAFSDPAHADPDHQCAFCARKAAEHSVGVVMVRFLGDDGTPLPFQASELFSLSERQRVVVKGSARLLADLLVVDVEGFALQ